MNWRNRGWIRDGVIGAALLCGVAACTWQGIKPNGDGPPRLYISGTAAHVPDARIAQIAAPYLKKSFLDVDLARLQKRLAAEPWLTDVNVSRHWPDGVEVHVAEHKPVAYWGAHGVLADDGTVFTPDAKTLPEGKGLVHLDGPTDSGLKVLNEYHVLSDVLSGHQASIAALTQDARGSWTATLADGLELRLGRDDLEARMRRFVDYALTRPAAQRALATAGYVDLRYSDGFAVGGTRATSGTAKDQENVG